MTNNLILDHISYAVTSTDNAISQFSLIYPLVETYKCHDKSQNIYITYLTNEHESHKIELIEAACKPSPIDSMLNEQVSVLYHTCYRSSNFQQSVNEFLNNGFIIVTPTFAPANEENINASHFYSEQTGIIEIIGK